MLPVGEFPQFASQGAAEYASSGVDPYAPVEGTKYAGALHQDSSYMRLSKTVDLTGASAAELGFQLSTSLESGYDHVIVEAHTVGQDNWTTLPERDGKTTTDPPAECEPNGFLLQLHPFLAHYLGGAGCTQDGSSGEWNSFTGSTGGWDQVAFDLAPFLGQQVELSITYMTDPATGGIGAFVDDTKVVVDGNTDADGFEGAAEQLDDRRTAGRQPAEPGELGNRGEAGQRLRRRLDEGLAPAGLRPRAAVRRRVAPGPDRQGPVGIDRVGSSASPAAAPTAPAVGAAA